MADIKAQSSHFPLLLVNQVVGSSLPSLPILTPVRPEVLFILFSYLGSLFFFYYYSFFFSFEEGEMCSLLQLNLVSHLFRIISREETASIYVYICFHCVAGNAAAPSVDFIALPEAI